MPQEAWEPTPFPKVMQDSIRVQIERQLIAMGIPEEEVADMPSVAGLQMLTDRLWKLYEEINGINAVLVRLN
jgi:hypothetical protein